MGYRAAVSGNKLNLLLGFSHPVEMEIPEGLWCRSKAARSGRRGDRQGAGRTVRSGHPGLRPPEPYKGKGIRYADERVRRKVGKAGAA